MGYTTDFEGELTLSKPLSKKQFDYINKFCETRRMKRDVNKLMELYDGKHGYPGRTKKKNTPEEIYGNEGEYFVGGRGFAGQDHDKSVIDNNTPPGQLGYKDGDFNTRWNENQRRSEAGECQPGLWCQWVVKDGDVQVLQWDGGEKFYHYGEWLKYLINHFFSKWDVKLNGEIKWFGEDRSDIGQILVVDNVVTVNIGTITY